MDWPAKAFQLNPGVRFRVLGFTVWDLGFRLYTAWGLGFRYPYIGIQRFKRKGIMEYEMNKNVTHGSHVMLLGRSGAT